jgi:hypothetical protein
MCLQQTSGLIILGLLCTYDINEYITPSTFLQCQTTKCCIALRSDIEHTLLMRVYVYGCGFAERLYIFIVLIQQILSTCQVEHNILIIHRLRNIVANHLLHNTQINASCFINRI